MSCISKNHFFLKNLNLRKHSIPSTTKPFSLRRIFLPCFELLWTNIFSETTEIPPSCNGSMEVDTETWNRRISLGFPAFFKQFWLHLRKNLSWYLKKKEDFKNKFQFSPNTYIIILSSKSTQYPMYVYIKLIEFHRIILNPWCCVWAENGNF